ncbi:MAG: PAS domain-containing protein, partial [Dehalococcoidia bacterium]
MSLQARERSGASIGAELLLIVAISALLIGLETATRPVHHLVDWAAGGESQAVNVWIDTMLLFGMSASVVALRRVRDLRGGIERQHMIESHTTESTDRESEARYRRLVDLAPDAILVHVAGEVRFANAAALTMLGAASDSEIVGRPFDDFICSDDRDRLRQRREAQRDSGAGVPPIEARVSRLDGALVPVETTAGVLSYEGRTAIQTVFRDVSARRETEDALHASEAKYRLIVEHINDIIYTAHWADDPSLASVRHISGPVEEIAGYGAAEFARDPALWFSLVHPDDGPLLLEATRKLIATRAPCVRTYRIRVRDGSGYRWLE